MANLQVVIGGQDLSAYVEQLERENHLCQPGHTFTLSMATDVPRTNLNPWATVVLHEQGVKVLTGYVDQVYFRRPPAKIIVRGKDNWKRAAEWFIGEQLYSTGEQVGAWVNYFCNLVGLSYVITATSGSTNAVKNELPLGMKHVSEALLSVCAYAGWCIRVRPDGVVDFRPTTRPTSADYDFQSTSKALDNERNDFSTRNVVKVYGPTSGSSYGPIYKETRNVPGITGERIMVFGDPNIDTYDKASKLGRAALDQFADLEYRTAVHIIGNPNIQVGQSGKFYTAGSAAGTIALITDLASEMNSSGYTQNLTLGRRCFRLPYFGITGFYGSLPFTSGSSLSNGLLAYWKIDETSGITRYDWVSSGSDNPLGLSYNPDGTDTQPYAPGIIGNSLLNPPYDPTPPSSPEALSKSASTTDVSSFYFNNRTVAFWAKLSDKSTNQALVGRIYAIGINDFTEWGVDYRVSTGIEGAVDRFRLVSGTPSGPQRNANVLGSPSIGQWYFFVVTQSTVTGVTFKINNVLQYSSTTENFGANNSGLFYVGARKSGLNEVDFMQGQADEVGIWGRVLTDNEQTLLYNDGLGRTPPFL